MEPRNGSIYKGPNSLHSMYDIMLIIKKCDLGPIDRAIIS